MAGAKPAKGATKRGKGLRAWLQLLVPTVVLIAVPALLLSQAPAVELFQNHVVFDEYQRLHPREYRDSPVRIVDIDDESLARIGRQWPWPRTVLAQLVDRLTELGAAAIAFDVVFPEADRTSPKQVLPLWAGSAPKELQGLAGKLPDHDQVFAESIAKSRVALGMSLTYEENKASPFIKNPPVFLGLPDGANPVQDMPELSGAVVNLRALEEAAAGNGSFMYVPEVDGIIRRVPFIVRLGTGTAIPSLAAEALRVAQGEGATLVMKFKPNGDVDKVKIGELKAPVDAKGRFWVYFTKDVPQRWIPIWKVMEKGYDGSGLQGSIVFIGTSATGLRDQRHTPISPIMAGVEVHANTAEQMVLQDFLERPTWGPGAEAAFVLVAGVLVLVLLERSGAKWGAAVTVLADAAAFGACWWAFAHKQWLIDPLIPSVGVTMVFVSYSLLNYVQNESERREIRNAFRHYMSPEMVERLCKNPELIALGGEMRRMTFHFCDVEGFTSISEFYDPFALIHFLNVFLSPMTEVILKHHGTIDKYIGDCIMAFWNAPLDDPEHAKNACLAAVEMHQRLQALNDERKAEAESKGASYVPIRIRTGLNSGNSIVGNMGSAQRFSYSVLGDDVNLASRLEGANKYFGTRMLASEATIKEAGGAVEVRALGQVRVVGKVVPIKVYELLAKKGELSADWQKALPLFDKGLGHFYAREFEAAAIAFKEVLQIFPQDGPSSLYLKQATGYSQQPPPESWEGIIHLSEK